jgi:5-methylthioadenosine/S-adenosylhomocysteine deaminase
MQLNNLAIHHPERGDCLAQITIKGGLIEKVEYCGQDLSAARSYATPSFVNSHLHPNQLLDRRLLDELSITELLHKMHGDYKKTDNDRYVQALFVLMEAIKSGATAIYAVASQPLPVIRAFKAFGLQGAVTCFYNDQWEGYGDGPAFANAIEEQFSKIYAEKTDRIDIHIGSASIESASNRLLLTLRDLAKKYQTKVNIHVSEGIASVESCIKSRQTTPIRLLERLGVLGENWNLIHAVNIDEEEIGLIAKAKAKVIHCPVSNAKTGVGVAPILALEAAGVTIALGSDACSNNNTNNVLSEAYFAQLIHNATHRDPRAVTIAKLKLWLTANGYEILGKPQKGILAEGEPADILLWSLKEPAFVPVPYGHFDSTLINNAPDIKPHTVIIQGKKAVENYRFKLMDEEMLCREANEVSLKIVDRNFMLKRTHSL